MENIPEEILERILSHLSPYDDMQSAAQVCMQWSRLIYGIRCQRWRRFYKQIVNAYPKVTDLSVAKGMPFLFVMDIMRSLLTNCLQSISYDKSIGNSLLLNLATTTNKKLHLSYFASVIFILT